MRTELDDALKEFWRTETTLTDLVPYANVYTGALPQRAGWPNVLITVITETPEMSTKTDYLHVELLQVGCRSKTKATAKEIREAVDIFFGGREVPVNIDLGYDAIPHCDYLMSLTKVGGNRILEPDDMWHFYSEFEATIGRQVHEGIN